MTDNAAYAAYMMAWISRLGPPSSPVLSESWIALNDYWAGDSNIDLAGVRDKLWVWVDDSGGPRLNNDRQMLLARMVLCLAYDDNRELEDMGFFEDLLNNFGVSRQEINRYNAQNPPRTT